MAFDDLPYHLKLTLVRGTRDPLPPAWLVFAVQHLLTDKFPKGPPTSDFDKIFGKDS